MPWDEAGEEYQLCYQDVIDLNVTKLNRADEDLHVILVEDQSKNKVYHLKQRVPNAFVTRSF